MVRSIKNIIHLSLSLIANIFYAFPSKNLTVIGITGTDGKTTTVSLLYHILAVCSQKAGMISTVGAKIIDQDYSIGLHATTPSPFLIQKLLKEMKKMGCLYAVLEVTSHAIDQRRCTGIAFELGILTNITHEHLDYHKTYDRYLETKVRFLKQCRTCILNKADSSYKKVTGLLDNKITTYGEPDADFHAEVIESNNNFQIIIVNNKWKIKTTLLGTYNVSNILAAFSACILLGLDSEKVVKAIESFKPVMGRMEIISETPVKAIVDFAHTPNAFEQVITAAREITPGKIIHVFGATGKRDKTKRPLMGEISGRLADISIITSEDTYGENPDLIIEEIEKGILKTNKIKNQNYFIISDRKNAIEKAFNIAKGKDTILLTGVGHQTSLNLGDREIPWNDAEEIKKQLIKRKYL